jgi:hypothetical protein
MYHSTTILSASVILLVLGASLPASGQEGSWLSVAECGASGSTFETTATTTEGSKEIVVADVGDFQVGQGVTVSKCNLHFTGGVLWGPRPNHAANRPLGDSAEFRGYDGSLGSWTPYVIDIPPATPHVFRYTTDLGRTWSEKTPITGDWQALNGGVEIRFGTLDWESGYVITFAGRDQLVSVIEKVEGTRLTLRDAANRAATDAVVRHCDDEAIQAAIDRAIQEKRNVYVPPGRYKLARGVTVANATGITLQGANGLDTVLDISDGEGACIRLKDGTEVTLRNLRFLGHSGFAERDQMGHLATQGATGVWGFYFKHCSALGISNTERVLVENCHASRMSAECFYSQGRSRTATAEPEQYTKAITYLRCSVVDSARNAFNNNDMAENTSVLHCRIVDVGGCTWEGASRFVRFCDNYVRNSGTVAMGNVRSRDAQYEALGTGQHIVSGNVFESGVCYGGCAIRAAACATQVIIADNLFVNFGSSAVEFVSSTGPRDLPAGIGTISGNLFDMTSLAEKPAARTAVLVTASDIIVRDNQVYVRGSLDPLVTAIGLREPALNVNVHDNLIRNCGQGIATGRASSRVAEVIDSKTFVPAPGQVPFERRQSHRYRGWNIAWIEGGNPIGTSVVEDFDPETCRFTLTEARDLQVGNVFEVFPPHDANWMIRANTILGCGKPVVLDSYGSETSWLRDNVIGRDGATGVAAAILVAGRFNLSGNQVTGFDEPESTALALQPDRFGNPLPNLYQGNLFERCANVMTESAQGLWQAATVAGNTFVGCASAPEQPKPK